MCRVGWNLCMDKSLQLVEFADIHQAIIVAFEGLAHCPHGRPELSLPRLVRPEGVHHKAAHVEGSVILGTSSSPLFPQSRIVCRDVFWPKRAAIGLASFCATRTVQWVRGGIEPRTQRTSDPKCNSTSSRTIRTIRRGSTPLLTSSFSVILRCAFRADVVPQAICCYF